MLIYRGLLDLAASNERAVGAFQFMNGVNSLPGLPRFICESVISSAHFNLSPEPEVAPQNYLHNVWKELDLMFGLGLTNAEDSLQVVSADFLPLPQQDDQLVDMTVNGFEGVDRIFACIGSRVDGVGGADELFMIDRAGSNLLVGGGGSDSFFLRPATDTVDFGRIFEAAASLPLPALTALADRERDTFLINTSEAGPTTPLPRLAACCTPTTSSSANSSHWKFVHLPAMPIETVCSCSG